VGLTPQHLRDADLVRDALAGQRTALDELLARHWATAVFLAGRVLGSADLGRDAAQEAAIAAMTDLARLRSPDRFGAWFCGIALNVSRRWRRQLRREVPGVPAGHGECASTDLGPDEAAELADLGARIRTAIGELAPGQRDAVLLFYLQGLAQAEVAAELGISAGAVKARLHQARAALAPRLAPVVEFGKDERMTSPTGLPAWVAADVAEIRRTDETDPSRRKHIMVLTERDGTRALPIWIGPAEATAMAVTLASAESPRPFTYKLTTTALQAAGSGVDEVRITRLDSGIFYASVLVRSPSGRQEVDARPSDAVNLALVAGAPIKVDNALFDSPEATAHMAELDKISVATAQIASEVEEELRRVRQGWLER
jgi:RNA polymerase sigma factor (sigma-70 family)